MPLTTGSRIGQYQIISAIGAGGMGEVYRARDTRLQRDVAIKTLPPAFASDPERRARFEREAQTLAALNHPHIAQIYGIEAAASVGPDALVMEFVEGEDLARRLPRSPVPIGDALAIARQIADALDAAHSAGIVHRDLKPANIKLRPDGTAKVLDFGLAKMAHAEAAEPVAATMTSPAMSQAGIVLGTATYMSPEQARGKPVDKRADIWAFGCVLYEMLTGHRPFDGETVTDVFSAVLTREPDWTRLPANTPPAVRRLLARCLQKDPKLRLRDIGDARLDLDASGDAPVPSARRSSYTLQAGTLLAAALVGGLAVWLARPETPPGQVRQLDILPQAEDAEFLEDRPVLAPTGDRLLIPAGGQLRLRHLSETAERVLAGTDGPSFVGWSPDGTEVAWVARRRLWRMAVSGGRATPIAAVPASLAGAGSLVWLSDGRLLLAGSAEALLMEVPAAGGTVRTRVPLTSERDRDLHEIALLPDERGVIAVWHIEGQAPDRIGVIDLRAGTLQEIARFDGERLGFVAWSPTGHVLFERSVPERGIWALPFDVETQRPTGEAFLAVSGAGMPSVARDGTLAYMRGGQRPWRQLVWVAPDGRITATVGRPQSALEHPALDGSGARALAVSSDQHEIPPEVWVWDTVSGTRTRLSTNPSFDHNPVWMPDGLGLLWSQLDRDAIVFRRPGSEELQTIASGLHPHPAPDGRTFVATTLGPSGSYDISIGTIGQAGMRVLVGTASDESNPRISPDGRLIAYVSKESGEGEIYVDTFPALGSRLQISSGGGHTPRWGSGGTLHYVADGRMMLATLRRAPMVLGGSPSGLFSLAEAGLSSAVDGFDVDPKGRFLMLRSTPRPDGPALVTVVTGTLPVLDRPRR